MRPGLGYVVFATLSRLGRQVIHSRVARPTRRGDANCAFSSPNPVVTFLSHPVSQMVSFLRRTSIDNLVDKC